MAKVKKFDFDNPAPVQEGEETLAAIDTGIRDAEAGRTVPAEEVRKLLRLVYTQRSLNDLSEIVDLT